jgi:hypothetical protein
LTKCENSEGKLEGEKRGKLYGKLGRGGIKEGKGGIRDWMRGGEDMNGTEARMEV